MFLQHLYHFHPSTPLLFTLNLIMGCDLCCTDQGLAILVIYPFPIARLFRFPFCCRLLFLFRAIFLQTIILNKLIHLLMYKLRNRVLSHLNIHPHKFVYHQPMKIFLYLDEHFLPNFHHKHPHWSNGKLLIRGFNSV